ncbi:MAG: VCBS repeat-containing protein [Bacteroidaceae bacterium]|nr:VCBS repeat-containing protein [Bacteroidaceae bacterium]
MNILATVVLLLASITTVSAQSDSISKLIASQIDRLPAEQKERFELWRSDLESHNRSSIQGNTLQDPINAGTYSTDFFYSDTQLSDLFGDQYGVYGPDIFYTFTLTSPMNVTLTHQGSAAFDTYMHLLNSSGIVIETNNDYDGVGHCDNILWSFIQLQLPAGTYYIVSEGNCCTDYITTNITGYASTAYGYSSIPSAYSVNPGTAVGGMGGQFGVSALGGATYSIPIEVPQGVNGLQPNLSITYNSQAGNSLCGFGASLSGISAITRGPKDLYHDGATKGVSYETVDVLYLDGVRLILDENSTAGHDNAIYYPESDPFTTVIEHNPYPSSGNNTWFEVQASDGMTYWYGYNQDSRLSYSVGNSQRIHSWYMCHAQQPTGNFMTYYYQQQDSYVYPLMITYGTNIDYTSTLSNVISFTYESRGDSVITVFDGIRSCMKRRLKTITSTTNGNTYRTYTLDYNTTGDGTAYKYSRLTSVTEGNAQGQQLPATQLRWSYLPAVNYAATNLNVSSDGLSSPTVSIDNQDFGSCDLNGDGIDDIIGYGKSSDSSDEKIYVYKYLSSRDNNGVRFTVDHQYSFTPSHSDVSGNVSDELIQELKSSTLGGSAVVDYDGDGRNEYLIGRLFKTYDMDANGISTLNKYMEFFMLREQDSHIYSRTRLATNCSPLYSTGDIDNDGRSDLVILETQSYDNVFVKLHILSSSVNPAEYTYNYLNLPVSNSVDYDLYLPYTPRQLFVSDMNGNGMQDLLVIYDIGYSVFWNRGGNITGTNLLFNGNVSDGFHFGQELTSYYMMVPGDYNGDGLMDILANGVESTSWLFFFSNGDGSFTCQTACTLNVSKQSFTDRDADKFSCNAVDFDRDGRTDIIVTKAHYAYHSDITGSWGTFHQNDTYWMRSTGTSLSQVYHATSCREEDGLSKRYVTGEFNGDGQIELLNYGYDCVNGIAANSNPVWHLYTNSNFTVQTGKVTTVFGDFGCSTNITYTTLVDSNVYVRGVADPYPAPKYTIPLNVVKRTISNGGAAANEVVDYVYEGLKIHLAGRGMLGFSKTVSNCTTTGVITESGVTQWDTTFYLPKVCYIKTVIGTDSAKTTSTLTIVDKDDKKYFAYPSYTMTTDMDGNTTWNYRSFSHEKGYILSDSTVYGTNMYRAISYQDYTSNKVGGAYLPQRVVMSQRHPDDNTASPIFRRITAYTYNSNGQIIQEIENQQSQNKSLTTLYTYDIWGNKTSQVSTGSGITTPCTTYYSYDQTHRFPVRIYTNPSSSVQKYTYDIWGDVLSEQDSINSSINNTITHTYNGWGQLIRTDMPDGTSTTYSRGWNNDSGKRYFILTQGTATPWIKTWYDNHGREVMTESIGPMDVSVTSTTTYNSKGLVTSHDETNGNLSLTHGYSYDTRGRVSIETAPGNVNTTYLYGNRSVLVTKNSRTTTTTYDAWGNVKTVTAPVSSVSNTYSSNGGIKQTVAGGATWTFGYDDRGNRTSMSDPDAGTTTYVYDALGREISRTDGRGVVFVTKYDYLGRVTQRKADSDAINYTYWTSGNGQMSLKSESNGIWTKSYGYDNLRRVTTETMSNGTVTKTRMYQYGSNGLLSRRTLPGNKAFDYTYDSYGNLTRVYFGSGAVDWTLTGYTGKQTVSETVIDDYTTHSFTKITQLDSNGMLDYIKTIQNNTIFQNDDYYFSPQTGNLMTWEKNGSYYPQYFSYDNADRLTGIQQNNQNIMSLTYSANGNIMSKTGMGSYEYGSTTRPHAVTAVDNTDGLIDMCEQEIEYEPWGKVNSIWQTDNNDFYYHFIEYGPEFKRVYSVTLKTYDLLCEKFYWDDYEEKIVGDDLYQYYYVYGGDGLAGLLVLRTTLNYEPMASITKTITDHLGSITGLVDYDEWVYKATFDAWGNREVTTEYDFDPTFDRGFSGHEHLLDAFGLINMNGRMYDPNLGRFLSPDNYIQSPYNPQNYNRYSYCLNNPLKYSDPSGDLFWEAVLIGAAIFGAGNTITHGIRGDIGDVGDGLKYFAQGALAGAALGATWYVAPSIPVVGNAIQSYMTWSFNCKLTMIAVSAVSGVTRGLCTKDWNGLLNSAELFLGNLYIDDNSGFGEGIWQGYSRHSWESLQTGMGHSFNQFRNFIWRVDRVDYFAGATYAIKEYSSNTRNGSLGNFISINIPKEIDSRFDDWVLSNPFCMHEFGHSFDSRLFGPGYLFVIGVPSLISTYFSKERKNDARGVYNSSFFYTELRANKKARDYFGRYYGVDWNTSYELFPDDPYQSGHTFETFFPTRLR